MKDILQEYLAELKERYWEGASWEGFLMKEACAALLMKAEEDLDQAVEELMLAHPVPEDNPDNKKVVNEYLDAVYKVRDEVKRRMKARRLSRVFL